MKKRLLLSIISGVLLVFAFEPFGAGVIAWAAIVPLLFALDGVKVKSGFLLGFVSGFFFFLGTVYWVVHSMYYYGGVPFSTGVFVMLLLVSYMSLYPALFGAFFAATGPARFLTLVILPTAWVSLEFLRGRLFTGFPWVLLGYSQTGMLPAIQIADITGVYGISWIIMVVNTGLFLFLRALAKSEPLPYKEALAGCALLTSTLVYGFIRIENVDTSIGDWRPLKVAVAQGNIDQSVKWDSFYQKKTIDIYKDLSVRAGKLGVELIVWPETAVPFYLEYDKTLGPLVFEVAETTGSVLLTGSPAYTYNQPSGTVKYYNSAILLSPEGDISGRYDKIHLVPFGEYVPLKRFLPFISKLVHGVGDFSSGTKREPLGFKGAGIGIGVLICYEAIFPELAREFVRNGATVLVNLTNDAWFGKTSAPYQHFEMSVLRAVENRTFLLRSANTGISAVVDPAGRIRKKSGLFTEDLLVDEVRLKDGDRNGGSAFYSRYGSVFAVGACFISGAFIASRISRRFLNV